MVYVVYVIQNTFCIRNLRRRDPSVEASLNRCHLFIQSETHTHTRTHTHTFAAAMLGETPPVTFIFKNSTLRLLKLSCFEFLFLLDCRPFFLIRRALFAPCPLSLFEAADRGACPRALIRTFLLVFDIGAFRGT